MLARRVSSALRGSRFLRGARAQAIPASMVTGGELVRLGGGENVPTPRVPELPTSSEDTARGLCGTTLALPPASVRVLRGIEISVGENVLRTEDGEVVVEGFSTEHVEELPRRRPGPEAEQRTGSAGLYGSPRNGTFAALVEALPRSLLLTHPALRPHAPITLLFDGRTSLVEEFLLERVQSHWVHLERMPAGSGVLSERTLYAAPVTRIGAGALPRWYRRWLDEQAREAVGDGVGRKLLLTNGPDDVLYHDRQRREAVMELGFTAVDTLTGAVSGDGTLDAAGLVAALREATVVVGASDDALGHAALCRKAEIVHIGTAGTVSPCVAQLAASRALPYSYVLPEDPLPALEVA